MENSTLTDPATVISFPALVATHDVSQFDCGQPTLNDFLRDHALTAPRHGLSQTWVAETSDGRIIGYFTLAVATVSPKDVTDRLRHGVGQYDIPCVLLARLAVDRAVQGQGLGNQLMERAARLAVALGRNPRDPNGEPALPLRALLVHAIDDRAAAFYRHWGLEPSPTDPLHLLILLKDLQRLLQQSDAAPPR